MAGGATAHGGEAQHLGGIQGGGLRRGQLLGDEDGLLRQRQLLLRHAQHQSQHPPAHVPQVLRAFGQQPVVQPPEQRHGGLDGGLPGMAGALAPGDLRQGLIQQRGVLQQLLVGLEDAHLRAPRRPAAQGLQFLAGAGQRAVEALSLERRVGALLDHRDILLGYLHHLPECHARRRADTPQDPRIDCVGRRYGGCLGARRRTRRNGFVQRFTATGDDQLGQGGDRLPGIGATGDQGQLVAPGRLQGHDGHQ
ncbi:hypothetical protein FQZ97_523240 [compost metagenome]